MSKSVNKVTLLGNLGADVESKVTSSGLTVSSISVATTERWKNKEDGNMEEATEWHRCVCFGKLADIVAKYAKKGSKVYLEGKNKTRQYEDKEGITRYSTEVVFDEFIILDPIN